VIGAVHAGWKGTQSEILPKTIKKMQEQYGSQAEDIIVAIGPAIGQCCYEVGAEVATYFHAYTGAVLRGQSEGKYLLDLKAVNHQQLLDVGVAKMHIEVTSLCTACQKARFFSYRAEQGCRGRFVSAIGLC
jgi:YfiH family protein